MKINENTLKGKWREVRGEIQKAWGKLSDDELDKAKGDLKAIGGLIQQRYGEAQESYNKKLSDILQRFESKKEAVVDEVKKNLRK
jgi:uncharacterized protein YjbJ (UPF0337 family)/uncharacterized membrane protein YtjA (UPF0391 family)